MTDMNFFSTFLDRKMRKQSRQVWIIFILLAVVLISVGVYLSIDLLFSGMKSDITALQNQIGALNQEASDTKLKTQLFQSYQKYGTFIDKIDREAQKTPTLTVESLEVIGRSVPQGVYLLNCNILEGQTQIKGKSPSNTAVGVFCRNLQLSGSFSDIIITNIAIDQTGSGTYDFDICCTVEGGELK